MATDKSQPRTPLIVLITVLVVVTLVSLKFIFDSYFTSVSEQHITEQQRDGAASVAARKEIQAEWESQLATPPTIEDAMRQLARGGRTGVALVAPTPSTDMGAVTGWTHQRPGAHVRPLAYAAPAPVAPPAPAMPEMFPVPAPEAPVPAPVPAPAPAPVPAPAGAPAHP